MKRSLLIKLGLLVGMTAGVEANAQVFNASDIYNADFYGYGGAVYNAMPLGQGAYADPGNNIWNGFACPNGPGSTAVFGGGRPNDFLLPGNPGNPYAWAVTNSVPFFSTGSQLLNPANYSSWSYANFPFANATSAGAVSPITIPFIDFTYYTWDNAGLDTGGGGRTNYTCIIPFVTTHYKCVRFCETGATRAKYWGVLHSTCNCCALDSHCQKIG